MDSGLVLVDQVYYFLEDYKFIIKHNKKPPLNLSPRAPKFIKPTLLVGSDQSYDPTKNPNLL